MTNNKYKILIIEDELRINKALKALLESGGYQVLLACADRNSQLFFTSHRPDLVILDVEKIGFNSAQLLRSIRQKAMTPVIVVSTENGEAEKVAALDAGANDYVTKPYSSNELMARIRAAIRYSRYTTLGGDCFGSLFKARGLVIDYDARRVFNHGHEVKLTQTEYNILAYLSAHAGKMLTYSVIIKAVWGFSDANSVKKLQVNMANIRKKFGAEPGLDAYVFNEFGVGYRMCRENS